MRRNACTDDCCRRILVLSTAISLAPPPVMQAESRLQDPLGRYGSSDEVALGIFAVNAGVTGSPVRVGPGADLRAIRWVLA